MNAAQLHEQDQNKSKLSLVSVGNITNKTTTKPDCFSKHPARHLECGQFCSLATECHMRFNEALFYGE